MHVSPFLFLSSLAASVAANVGQPASHGVSYNQHRRHHGRAHAQRDVPIAQKVPRSRKRCARQSASALSQILSSSTVVASVPTSLITSSTTVTAGSSAVIQSSAQPQSLSTSTAVAQSITTSSTTSAIFIQTTMSTSSKLTLSSSSSSAPPATSSSSSGGSTKSGSLQSKLFPVHTLSSWTTAKELDGALPLSDGTLQPGSVIKALTHDYVQMAGKSAMQAVYAAGSWNLQNTPRGGLSFYAPGPAGALDLSKAREVLFSYSVYFPEGFQFVMGGKLPGLYGGNNQKDSESCSGGRRDDACFSSRVMWRTDGAGEMYTYLPPSIQANQAVCSIGPYSECNPTYGASIARGSFTFATGAWTTVAMRVRLNDVGQEDGELQLWANGQSMFSVGGLVLRTSEDARIWGIQMQTFFGGSTQEWSTPTKQESYFADFSMGIVDEF